MLAVHDCNQVFFTHFSNIWVVHGSSCLRYINKYEHVSENAHDLGMAALFQLIHAMAAKSHKRRNVKSTTCYKLYLKQKTHSYVCIGIHMFIT